MSCKSMIGLSVLVTCAFLLTACSTVAPRHATGSAAAGVVAENKPLSDEHIERVLDAMGEASTVGHPDLRGLFNGLRAFYRGDYKVAREQLLKGAWYGDKLSQLSIGMMYLNGNGVDKDPARACAWMALAAERGYPRYEATRRQTCQALDRTQHAMALKILASLEPDYADAATVPRMKIALTRGMQQSITGSYLGSTQNVSSIFPKRLKEQCNGLRLMIGDITIPKRGCGTYQPELWQAREYYQARAPRIRGIVTVGAIDKPEADVAEQDGDSDEQPAPTADAENPAGQ